MRVRLFVGDGDAEIPRGLRLILGRSSHVTVLRCTDRSGSRFNLTFEEIGSREEAEEFRNASIHIPRENVMEELGFIPLYLFSGLTIRTRGRDLRVVDVEPADSNPQLTVEKDGVRFHVPVILVTSQGEIDWKEMRVVLDLPEGIEELSI